MLMVFIYMFLAYVSYSNFIVLIQTFGIRAFGIQTMNKLC